MGTDWNSRPSLHNHEIVTLARKLDEIQPITHFGIVGQGTRKANSEQASTKEKLS